MGFKPRTIFLTTNRIKLEEARPIFANLESLPIELVELQDPDPAKVVHHKLTQIPRSLSEEAVLVEDTGLSFVQWGTLPGAYIKSFLSEVGVQNLPDLLPAPLSRDAIAISAVGIAYKGNSAVFTSTLNGRIVPAKGDLGGWTPVFQPEGETETLGSMSQDLRHKITMRRKPLLQALAWFNRQTASHVNLVKDESRQ